MRMCVSGPMLQLRISSMLSIARLFVPKHFLGVILSGGAWLCAGVEGPIRSDVDSLKVDRWSGVFRDSGPSTTRRPSGEAPSERQANAPLRMTIRGKKPLRHNVN